LEGVNPDFYELLYLLFLYLPVVKSRSSFEGAGFALKNGGPVTPPDPLDPEGPASAVQCRCGIMDCK
jgi:hypothetical protein